MNIKYLSLILALVMVVSTFGIANAAPTNNVKVDWLVDKGIVKGDAGTGDLRLMDTITRAEAAVMIVRVQGLETLAEDFKSTKNNFKDVPSTHWANGYINVVASNGVVNGYPDGTFKPEGKITYAEVIKMLVVVKGDLPVINELVSWEVPYITKALEVKILEGVTVESYKDSTVRIKMFEMAYNLMAKDTLARLEAYKGIVVENRRVSGLYKNEIAIEVIERNPGSVSYRYEKGSRVRIKLLNVKEDTDYLLGKVVDVTINESDETSSLAIDNSYSYLTGSTTVRNDKLTINGKTYGVRDTNRFANSFDKLVVVFHNDMKYRNFKDYFEKIGKSKEFTSDFSNVTMKGNSILFIDSFAFEDIAPVKETIKSGAEVYIYKDDSNGSVTKISFDRLLGYAEAGFKSLEPKDIKANDVVHIYDRDKAIVKSDALKTGTFDRYRRGADSSYIQVDGKKHLVVEVNKRRPVYSLDGTRFFTLFANRGDLDLEPLIGEKIKLVLDVNNNFQSIVGNIKYDEGVFVIADTAKRSANVIGPNNGNATVVVEFDSVLNLLGSNSNKSIEDFHRGDLVYIIKDGSRIEKMVRMAKVSTISSQAKPVVKTSRGGFELSKSWIKVDDARNLTSNFAINNANVFIISVDDNKVPRIEGTTLDFVIDNAKSNSNLKAYIITNRDFNIMNLGNSIRFGDEANIAHTIIFTNFENTTANLRNEVVEVTFKYTPGRNTIIEGKDINGKAITRNVGKYSNIPALVPGDIVELGIDKDKVVAEARIKIPKSEDSFKVIEVDKYSSKRARLIVLEDSNKVRKDFYILRDALDFGEVEAGNVVSVSFNLDKDIDVLVVRDRKTTVNGKF